MKNEMGHLKAKGIVEDFFLTLPDVDLGLKIPNLPAFKSIEAELRKNAHKKKPPPRIKASLERKFSIGLKLSINTWTKDRKILAGHIACFAKRWPIVDDADVVMFEEPALVFFYIGFFSAKHETVEVTKGAYTVHASVGQHALVRMLQREATIPEEFPKIAVQALKIAAFLADISEAHSGFKKSNYWKKTHTIAVPFKGGALILVSHFLGPAFAGYSKRNYSVRTWLSSDQLSIEVKQSMKGWSELSKNGRLESDSDYLENIFLPKDFYYD